MEGAVGKEPVLWCRGTLGKVVLWERGAVEVGCGVGGVLLEKVLWGKGCCGGGVLWGRGVVVEGYAVVEEVLRSGRPGAPPLQAIPPHTLPSALPPQHLYSSTPTSSTPSLHSLTSNNRTPCSFSTPLITILLSALLPSTV